MKIHSKSGSVDVSVRKVGFFGKGLGLMFRSKKIGNLLFEFGSDKRRAIHSLFVFFPFLAVWLDSEDRVLETRVVKPFRFSVIPSKPFRKLVEIPLDEGSDLSTAKLLGKV